MHYSLPGRVGSTHPVVRSAVYSRWLPPFGLGSVTVCDPALLCASPSQKPACGTPARASSHGHSPPRDEWHQATWPGERMALGVATEALPGATASVASAMEPREHHPLHGPLKAVPRRAVIGHAAIIEVPPHLAAHRLPEVGECVCVAPFIAVWRSVKTSSE